MRGHTVWILLILPIVMALPENKHKPLEPFKNGSLPVIVPKRTTLEEILKEYNIEDLIKRVPSRTKRESCPIDKDLLLKLADLIKKNRNFVPTPSTGTVKTPVAPSAPESGTPCELARAHLSNNLRTLLRVYFAMLTSGAALSEEEFNRLKKIYDDLRTKFEDDFQIIRETDDADVKEATEELLREKSSLEVRLNSIVSDIQFNITIQKKLRENQIDLIVSDIYSGKYETAKTNFLDYGRQDLTFSIVDKMASKPNNENLLKFIKELPWLLHRMIGYEAMLKKKNLEFSVFTLEHDFNELVGYSNDPNIVRESQHIINFVRKNINEQGKAKISAMANLIATKQPNDYNDIIVYSKEQQKPFNAHLEELVEKVYEITDNDVDIIERILAFSDALTQIAQSGRVYVKLYKLMEHNREIAFESSLKIAFKVKELFLMTNYKNTPEEVKKAMLELKEKVPPSVKSIIWGQVCIKNEELGAFLHSKGPYDSSRKNINLAPNKDLWEFEGTNNAESFRLRHVETKEYLYAESDELSYSTFKRRLFTWSKNNAQLINQFWLLEDLQWREGKFLIKNKIRNEYLNAEEMPEQASSGGSIDPELDAISKKDAELASRIKQLIASSAKTDRLQAFTWRRRSKGNNPEWLFVDSSNC